ncbi:MAG: penicillin-binding transpeptidase domain-containing protein, partial [Gemmatimonadales bacterium]
FMAVEARTGYVRALVGGRDFADSWYNRATQAQRQAGSTFKPFVYAAAVRVGHPVSELVDDSPLSEPLTQADSTLWNPKDYDDTTLGWIPMRRSLFESRNLSTIKLGMQLGEPTVIGEARRFGVTTPLPPFPAIHIGAASVFLSEMVEAYSAFANLGYRVEPIFIEKVEDQQGNILWQPTIRREQVMEEAQAWLMLDMLRDVIRRGTAYTAVTAAGFRLPAGGKTGTTDTYTDAWFVGFTPDLVAGIWVGFDLPQPILPSSAGGGRIAAPAWTMFMREVYDRRPSPGDWRRSDSLAIREVDWDTGYLYTPFCPVSSHRVEFYIPGTEPTRFCPLHSPFGPGVSLREPGR